MKEIIGRGAEAVLIKQDSFLIKDRIKKSYRIKIIDDNLRKRRTKKEAKLLEKVFSLIPVPRIIETDNKQKIKMRFIKGKKLSEHLDSLKNWRTVCKEIGASIAKLHDSNIIHGDLTTSNMIYVENTNKNYNKTIKSKEGNKLINIKDNISEQSELKVKEDGESDTNFKIYFIDFGLSFHSHRIEDKAVDLHLLRQALEAKHFLHWKELFDAVIKGYNSKDREKVLKQLEKVEARGRYKKGF